MASAAASAEGIRPPDTAAQKIACVSAGSLYSSQQDPTPADEVGPKVTVQEWYCWQ